jgi:hypothetical protein
MKRLALILVLILFLPCAALASSQQNSTTSVSDFISDVRSYLNDTTETFWSDSEILEWTNDGLVDIAANSRAMQSFEDLTTVQDQVEYTVTSAYVGVDGVLWTNSTSYKALLRKDPFDPNDGIGHGQTGSLGEPAFFAEYGGKVLAWPTSDADDAGNTLRVFYTQRPDDVTTSDNLPVPAIYDKALKLYVVAQAMRKDLKHATAAALMAEYAAEIDRFRADYITPKEAVE